MKCSKCGSENSVDSKFCTSCGNVLEPETQNAGQENINDSFGNNQQNFQGEGFNPYNSQPYNGYNNYNNYGMMPNADYERENGTARTLAVLSIVIGVISIVFSIWSIFTGANYGAVAAFVLAIGAVVKAKPECVKGAKTAAVIIAVIALAISTIFSFVGNVTSLVENSQEMEEYYDENDLYDYFYHEFGGELEDDFADGFGIGANGEIV